jgi:hypothetical protein
MPNMDAMTVSREHRTRVAGPRQLLPHADASRNETYVTAGASPSPKPTGLTPEGIDEQIRHYFSSNQL